MEKCNECGLRIRCGNVKRHKEGNSHKQMIAKRMAKASRRK